MTWDYDDLHATFVPKGTLRVFIWFYVAALWNDLKFIGPAIASTKAAIPEFRTLITELEAWRNCDSPPFFDTGFFRRSKQSTAYLNRSRNITQIKWKTFGPKRRYKDKALQGLADAQHSGQGQTCQKQPKA